VASLASTTAWGRVEIELVRCGDLDGAEVRRLLDLELVALDGAGVAERSPTVTVTCAEGRVAFSVRDPRGRELLQRVLPAPDPDQPGRERVVALAASQMLTALEWLPEEAEPDAPPAASPPEQPPRRVSAARRTAPAPASGAPSPLRLGGFAAVRARHLHEPFPVLRFGAAGQWHLSPDWHVAAYVAGEGGERSVAGGSVRARAVFAGIGVGHTLHLAGAWSLVSAVRVFAGYGELRGVEPRAGFESARARGALADVELAWGPQLQLGPGFFEVRGEGGSLFPNQASGLVEGESAAGYGGVWLGASLGAGLRWP
jgi:hypothetical protein